MTIPEKACAWAKQIAIDNSHGYDQHSRWGPDYDCSSLVISAYKEAGVPLTCTYTGNMRVNMLANGFKDVTAQINLPTGAGLKEGDVLLHETNHTALYIGNGQLVNAGGNEVGTATGGKTGDQTGKEIRIMGYYNYPWQYVLRYIGKENDTSSGADAPPSPPVEGQTGDRTYTVKQGDSLWGIAERELGDGLRYEEIRQLNHLDGYTIYPGQKLLLPPKNEAPEPEPKPDPMVSVTVSIHQSAYDKWKQRAAAAHLSLSEYLEEIL